MASSDSGALFEETPFSRNIPTISEEDQDRLAMSRVCVVGCGGIGGFVCEFLVRLGVGSLVAVDADSFAVSNLNRQVLCTRRTLDKPKAECAQERALSINPRVRVEAVCEFLDEENAPKIIAGCDVVVDALDNPKSRVVLEEACAAAGIPLVHGAVRGRMAQVAVILPGEGTLSRLYAGHMNLCDLTVEELRTVKSCLSFTPPFAACMEVSEAMKLLLGQPRGVPAGQVMLFDLATMRPPLFLTV